MTRHNWSYGRKGLGFPGVYCADKSVGTVYNADCFGCSAKISLKDLGGGWGDYDLIWDRIRPMGAMVRLLEEAEA
jgi:hypothetical protein